MTTRMVMISIVRKAGHGLFFFLFTTSILPAWGLIDFLCSFGSTGPVRGLDSMIPLWSCENKQLTKRNQPTTKSQNKNKPMSKKDKNKNKPNNNKSRLVTNTTRI